MPWSIPIPALTDRGLFQKAFTGFDGDQQELNLWDFFGQPNAPADVIVSFDTIEVRTLILGNWAAGSIISIEGLGGMQFRGRGGNGGTGASAFFEGLLGQCLALAGLDGGPGVASIICPGNGITINYNGDDCFAWGGGGGGGGGGFEFTPGCIGGCGGGGAQGWDTNSGGTSDFNICDGSSGNNSGPGTGGTNATLFNGGDGGSWGTAGDNGTAGTNGGQGSGGLGGRAIQVPATDTFNITGLKNQATLESEGRLLGRNGDPIGA